MHDLKFSVNSQRKNTFTRPLNIPKFKKPPLSEQDILCLQDSFLEVGIHYIKVRSVATGRTLVETFLKSLNNYYDNVACLTASKISVNPKNAFDVFKALEGKTSREEIERFFIEQFYFDFLWIEASQDLISKPWFHDFQQLLANFKIEKSVPVMVITYS